ncbi:SPOPL [Cordylochernes scorpioides]|uniref:SPOPL n=1 Tax=Cordylochernes scorpioides TaxID=51811 RepID=A0ABY6K6J4_9ARAC|nr:SPOPL [Cordylochernes scorpioides]
MDTNPTADTYFYTIDKVYSCSCMWIIENFSTRPEKNEEYIESNSFSSENIKDLKWKLYIYPNGMKSNGGSKAADLLPDDKLTLYCQVTLHQTSTTNIVIPITNSNKVCNCGLMKDFGCLLESKELSDVILRAENNKEIHAHKNILSARSSVLAAMFKNEMKEKKENCVDLSHIKFEILEQVIYYIYTDSCPKLIEMADKILPLANMYDLENLKIQCEKELITEVKIYTVTQILILAHIHSANQLKEYSIKFFKIHAADVVKTSEWKAMESYPQLLMEILSVLSSKEINSDDE